jgi:hypothetical protein
VDDDAERVRALAVPAELELLPEPLADRLADVVADRSAHLRPAAITDRLDPAGEEELDLPGLQQSLVLGIARISHREGSRLGHGPILRRLDRPTR